ncbi:proto-oncogene serine/threonine-protein kinase mos [Octodon degus]|uniref:Proto-oncogene serine/threonine-protein kinase mos n=1 Tax=Octodon degus TaxID=10160 RepID=A0A6P3FB43_OCTDE|nr:proto-oncogene serine/threonine-protein kinase mos [Octodon degus]
MPSPLALCRRLPREPSPSVDSRPCSSPCELPGSAGTRGPRLPRRPAWCSIDWEQVRLLHRLGAGGFGSVYKATYRGVPVAVKQVCKRAANPRASRRSFWAELNVARLRHSNLVRVVAASARAPAGSDSVGTIIMEFGGHVTLHQAIYGAAGGPGEAPWGLRRCLQYSLDVANGLLFLHARRIVHLDLKPANIFISEQDVCKIGDFGCSAKLEDLRGARGAAYRLGGTYTHQAPELLRGEPVTAKADVYAFAITLWQMSTRGRPYAGERQHVLYAVVAQGLRPSLAAAVFTGSGLGRGLAGVIERGWRAQAPQRPSAQLLLQELGALRGLLGADAGPDPERRVS